MAPYCGQRIENGTHEYWGVGHLENRYIVDGMILYCWNTLYGSMNKLVAMKHLTYRMRLVIDIGPQETCYIRKVKSSRLAYNRRETRDN